jgi:pimeloyl-ACP methyl ester carboxylesterase
MSTWQDAAVREAAVPQGTIRYRELGTGEPIVFVHGFLNNGLLWRKVAPELARDFRVIVPDWPLGSHELPLREGSDLSLPGLARIVADFLEALELENVTLVGNDTGGAVCQLVAVHHPARLGRLVLTPCDAYDNFLPTLFTPLTYVARVPGAVRAIGMSLRPRFARGLPFAFGWLAKKGIPHEVTDAYLAPALRDKRVRKDVAAILKGVSKRYTQEAAQRFGEFDRPVLIVWATEDKVFPLRYGERLARDFPDARLEQIADSYTYVSEDQPERTTAAIGAFAREPAPARA